MTVPPPLSPPALFPPVLLSRMWNSTRRFFCPASVLLSSIGRFGPKPAAVSRAGSMPPRSIRYGPDRVSAIVRELLVELVRAPVVGVALDRDERDLRVHLQEPHDLVEDAEAVRQDPGAAGRELHLLQDLDLARPPDAADELRAAVLRRLGARLARLLRAGVLRVRDAVLVGVVLRAAVGVVDLVEVLGLIRALVARVGDAVAVAIGQRRAAVVGVRRLAVLGIGRAEIDVVREPVLVRVRGALAAPPGSACRETRARHP